MASALWGGMSEILSKQGNPIGSFWHRAEFDGTESADDAQMKALGWQGAVWSYTQNCRAYMHGLSTAYRAHLSFEFYGRGTLRCGSIETFDMVAQAIAKVGGGKIAEYLPELGAVKGQFGVWEIAS
jgi:hypothetical protein